LEAPKNLTLTVGEDGAIDADWDDVADVDHYVISRQRVGSDQEFIEETRTFFESEGTIGPFASGETVRAKVRAVRGDRSSPDSAVAEITLPAQPGVPAVPGQPSLTTPTSTEIIADWPDSVGAMFYRVYKQDLENDPNFVLLGSSTVSQSTLVSMRPGATVRVRITAVNNSGESAPSPFAEITMPGG
jgi:predicted phage tail protein